ncbi:HNH endonuclease signature motif containing protein [Streptosporangium sp. NPDC051022]|uniref:HNH endonuclease n=1 Tax=Streptosporangium sp. NPDC051022 TaxID=3155752 RepID=UPI0034186622
MLEAGHRCAIPTCRTVAPLNIEHIEDWAKVGEHRFENLIVLCANCHGLKVDKANPRHLDRKALRQYKANLGLLNARYSDFERRVIQWFAERPGEVAIKLGGVGSTLEIELMHLLRDGILMRFITTSWDDLARSAHEGELLKVGEVFGLTEAGMVLVEQWKAAQPIEALPGISVSDTADD